MFEFTSTKTLDALIIFKTPGAAKLTKDYTGGPDHGEEME